MRANRKGKAPNRPKTPTASVTIIDSDDENLWTNPTKGLKDLATTASTPDLWTPKNNHTIIVIPKVPYARPTAPPPPQRKRTDSPEPLMSTSVPRFTPNIVTEQPCPRPIPLKRSLLPEFDNAAKLAKMSEYDDSSSDSDGNECEIVR